MSYADQRRAKAPPPAPDDLRLRRTCNCCGRVRNWVQAVCVCGCAEFSLSEKALEFES